MLTLSRPTALRSCALFTGLLPTMLLATPAARGEIVEPGAIASDFETTLADRPDFGGAVRATQSVPFTLRDATGKDVYTATLFNQVLEDRTSGTLSFYYRFQNTGREILGIDDVAVQPLRGFATDVATLLDTGGQTAPPDALRSEDGGQVFFDFDAATSRIGPGQDSFTFLVKTDATRFAPGGAIDIDAFTASSLQSGSDPLASGHAEISGFRPVSVNAIPLPAAAAVGIPGLVSVTLYTARRRQKQGSARRGARGARSR